MTTHLLLQYITYILFTLNLFTREILKIVEMDEPSGDVLLAILKQKQQKREELLNRIQEVRSKRNKIRDQNEELKDLQKLWMHRYNEVIEQRYESISTYSSHEKALKEVNIAIEKLNQVYVLIL